MKLSTAQFENRSGDKVYNLSRIDVLSKIAAEAGSDIVCFHECSITGYTFARNLSKSQLTDLAEFVPTGESILKLIEISRKNGIAILAGLFEKDSDGNLYKTVVAVNGEGLLAKFRKIHPFINPHLTPGKEYCVFDFKGVKCGILICYDNNIIENVRATCLLGAEIVFMPHVTMCTPSSRPGAGFVDSSLWANRQKDPTSLRLEFDGMKGRDWLMKWLPARAYDNGVYVVFSNPIGMDDDQLKNGCSMIIDPFGDVIVECRELDDQVVTTEFIVEKIKQSGGYRYRMARKPELYGSIISSPHQSIQKVVWLNTDK